MALGIAAAAPACIPDPDGDFEEYQARIKEYDAAGAIPTSTGTGGTSGGPVGTSGGTSGTTSGGPVDSGPPPTEVTEGTYFASCLSELANGQVSKTFSFWATTKFTPNQEANTGGTLDITLGALQLEAGKPPTIISPSNIISTISGITGTTNATGSFVAALPPGAKGAFDGKANPISGSNVVIVNAGLKGVFATGGFCARLTGHVEQPAPAERDLDENRNTCLFTVVKDGDTAPTRTFQDYLATNCPL